MTSDVVTISELQVEQEVDRLTGAARRHRLARAHHAQHAGVVVHRSAGSIDVGIDKQLPGIDRLVRTIHQKGKSVMMISSPRTIQATIRPALGRRNLIRPILPVCTDMRSWSPLCAALARTIYRSDSPARNQRNCKRVRKINRTNSAIEIVVAYPMLKRWKAYS